MHLGGREGGEEVEVACIWVRFVGDHWVCILGMEGLFALLMRGVIRFISLAFVGGSGIVHTGYGG